MITQGSIVVMRTTGAIYQPCEIVAMSEKTVTVKFFSGMKKKKGTGGMYADYVTESISRKNIVSMSERF